MRETTKTNEGNRTSNVAADERGKVSIAEMKNVPLTALLRADEHNFGCGAGC